MRKIAVFFICTAMMATSTLLMAQTKTPAKASAGASTYVPVKEYDPKRDATKDVADAVKEAQRTNKNVLVEIGGKWCIWCTYFDKFFAENSALAQYRDQNYVMVKVNFSPENKN